MMIYVLAAIGVVATLVTLGVVLALVVLWHEKHSKEHRYVKHLMEEDKDSYWKTL